MICWQCEKSAGRGLFCASCGAVLPADPETSYFDVLGEAPRFALDLKAVERSFKEGARRVHPDKFGQADPRARKAALSQTAKLNEAWRTLRDDERRARYLLGLGGVATGTDEATSGKAAPVPPALLMEVLELREALAEARASQDHARVEALAAQVRTREARRRAELHAALEGWLPGSSGVAAEEKARAAVAALVALRYDRRFLEEVEAYAESDEPRGDLP